ncbi:hypothetical protein D3C72_2397740 [compost metagenome]
MKISTSSLAKFKSKLDRLVVELQDEARFENDTNVPVIDTGILMAFRPWKYTYMEAIKKN